MNPNSAGIQRGDEEPLYNIGVVTRMTGISMATLRAWERRYDFPESKRTVGGHRLYSEKDVHRLRWVKRRIDEGMQTSQAIHALRHQERTGILILTGQDLSGEYGKPIQPVPGVGQETVRDDNRFLAGIRDGLLQGLVDRNLPEADRLLGEALAISSPEDLILKVIAPTLGQMGDLWETGTINVATEHLATNYLRHRLLMWMLSGPPPVSNQPVVLACAPHEWHEGSLLVLGSLLRRRRWLISYLGQAVPLSDLAAFVQEINPFLIVSVAMTEKTAAYLEDWPQWLPEAAQTNRPMFCYGGRIYLEHPEWRLKTRGIYLGNTFEEGLATLERLLI